MDMRVHEAKRSPFGKFIAWAVLILGLIGAVIGIADLDVVYAVCALIVVAVAGMYLLAHRATRVSRADGSGDLFAGG